MDNNKYNSLTFRVWLDFADKSLPPASDSEEDQRVQKIIRLKLHKIGDDVFAYLRASLMQKQKKDHLLVSTPVDPEFELLVVACAIKLL